MVIEINDLVYEIFMVIEIFDESKRDQLNFKIDTVGKFVDTDVDVRYYLFICFNNTLLDSH